MVHDPSRARPWLRLQWRNDMNDQPDPVTRNSFDRIAESVCTAPADADRILLSLAAETSEFIRLNQARVRQATSVQQVMATLSAVAGQRLVSSTLSLPDDPDEAINMLLAERAQLVNLLPMVPADPHLLLPDRFESTSRTDLDIALPETDALMAQVMNEADGLDLVGFHASGPSVRAFADSRGQRNWHRVASFNLDWSLYAGGQARDRAVKSAYAGTVFSADALSQRIAQAREQLERLRLPARTLSPGRYRVLLAPAAVAELLQAMAWSGFSRKDRESGTSSLMRLDREQRRLAPGFTLAEATQSGIAPAFTEFGHIRPGQVRLVTAGQLDQTLISPRTGAEFGIESNTGSAEYPASLTMAGGAIEPGDMLAALDTGLLISNLWYLNYSDRQQARVTGMTRFACFAVEQGRIVAPVGVMRFDDSLLDLFGDSLAGLSAQVEFVAGSSTWGARELSSVSCPAMLLHGLSFTL